MKKRNTTTIILISIIVVLLAVLGYEVYNGLRARAIINSLNADKNDLTAQLNILQGKYDLLEQDVAKIYKTCMKENACKGRFPNVSWYCNNVGDEASSNPSHVCFCDSSCNLNATQMNR